ncbi:MAG: CRISPR system precrRNA processing endoribonuclease RAMP protein Cas6 [Candidatus Dadabacteria bacterium]|nr:MAG: CRISPR system precrRNA processing endoribonuclease RAMP protein Cas6 [Candidatus Dadabacteria bacterium]
MSRSRKNNGRSGHFPTAIFSAEAVAAQATGGVRAVLDLLAARRPFARRAAGMLWTSRQQRRQSIDPGGDPNTAMGGAIARPERQARAPQQIREFKRSKTVDFVTAIPIARYRFVFGRGAGRLPAYTGSAWRGTFGRNLRRAACSMPATDCPECPVSEACPYSYLFESPPPPATERMRRYTTVPSPYVIEPEETFDDQTASDAEYRLGVTLVGRGNQYLPYVVHAFAQAGRNGIGTDRVRMRLRSVERFVDGSQSCWQQVCDERGRPRIIREQPVHVPTPPEPIVVELLTPLRLIGDGKLVRPERFVAKFLLTALIRRTASLGYFHCGLSLPDDDQFRRLARQAGTVDPRDLDLHWADWTRYSTRQKTAMQMGGLVGRIVFDTEMMRPFWPFLWIGQWLHVGRGTTMGLGRYRIAEPGGEKK